MRLTKQLRTKQLRTTVKNAIYMIKKIKKQTSELSVKDILDQHTNGKRFKRLDNCTYDVY